MNEIEEELVETREQSANAGHEMAVSEKENVNPTRSISKEVQVVHHQS